MARITQSGGRGLTRAQKDDIKKKYVSESLRKRSNLSFQRSGGTFTPLPYVHTNQENFTNTVRELQLMDKIYNARDLAIRVAQLDIKNMINTIKPLEDAFVDNFVPKGISKTQFLKQYQKVLSNDPIAEAIRTIKKDVDRLGSGSRLNKQWANTYFQKVRTESEKLVQTLEVTGGIGGNMATAYRDRFATFVYKLENYLSGAKIPRKKGSSPSVVTYKELAGAMGSVFEMVPYYAMINMYKEGSKEHELISASMKGIEPDITLDFEDLSELMGRFNKPTTADISIKIPNVFLKAQQDIDGVRMAGINVKSMYQHSLSIGKGAPKRTVKEFGRRVSGDNGLNKLLYFIANTEAFTRTTKGGGRLSDEYTTTNRQIYSSILLMNLRTALFGKDIGFGRPDKTYTESVLHVLLDEVYFTTDILKSFQIYLNAIQEGDVADLKGLTSNFYLISYPRARRDKLERSKLLAIRKARRMGAKDKDSHTPITYDLLQEDSLVKKQLESIGAKAMNGFDLQASILVRTILNGIDVSVSKYT